MTGWLKRGTRVGGFEVEALIGYGASGQVYRARQLELDRPVALKLLASQSPDHADLIARFRREATTMRDLEHPSIVTVYDAGESGGRLFLAMRLIAGRTLKDVIADGPAAPDTAVELLRPIAEALDFAHGRQVVHRDIKPANILVGDDGRAYLTDFGVAKVLSDPSATMTQGTLGTPRYMAPEQGAGADHRADLYSLACVAFELLTGTPPYQQRDYHQVLIAHLTAPPPRASERNPTLPREVDAVLAGGMAKEPARRYATAGEFLGALRDALSGGGHTRRWGRPVLVSAAAVAVIAVGVGQWLGTPSTPTPPAPPPPPAEATVLTDPASVPATPSPATLAGVARGRLMYQAPLDGTPRGFIDAVGREEDRTKAVARQVPGALEFEAFQVGGRAGIDLDVETGLTRYLAELDVSVRPGSDVDLCWSLRWAVPGKLAYYWCMSSSGEFAQFKVYDGLRMEIISPRRTLPGLQSGRTVRVAVLLRENQLSMYIDDALVTDTVNNRVPMKGTVPSLELKSREGIGLVTVHGLRVHALA